MKKVTYKHTADAIAIIHAIWLGSLLSILPFSFKYRKLQTFAATGAILTVGSWNIFGDCPMYLAENYFRKKADPRTAYTGSFTGHYLKKYFHIKIPPKLITYLGYGYAGLALALMGRPCNHQLRPINQKGRK